MQVSNLLEFSRIKKMKYNLFFYGIGFLILIFTNSYLDIQNSKNSDYQLATFKRCLEIQKSLNLPLKKCLN